MAWTAVLSIFILLASTLVHLRDIRRGGLEVVLADRGCPGFLDAPTSAADCSRTVWTYSHWWVVAAAVFVLGVVLGVTVAATRVAMIRRPPSSWDPWTASPTTQR